MGFVVAVHVTTALTVPQATTWSGGLIVAVVMMTLVVGAWVLRPRMDARVRPGETADSQPRHALHAGYVMLERVKVVLLLAIGVAGLLG